MTKIPVCDKCQAAASGRLLPVRLPIPTTFERLLSVKADVRSQALENSMSNRPLPAQKLPLR